MFQRTNALSNQNTIMQYLIMNKAIELQEIKNQIAELSEALALAKSSGASPVIINALETSINGLVDDYIATL